MSETDWDFIKHRAKSNDPIPYDPEDGPYDPNDEAATEAYLSQCTVTVGPGKRGPQKAHTKQLVSLRLSKEVLDHFKATGRGWQTRIDETLKRAVNK
jgi:uncharacterized protein (DUF4415 family)